MSDNFSSTCFFFQMEILIKRAPIYLTPSECARQFLDDLLEVCLSSPCTPLILSFSI